MNLSQFSIRRSVTVLMITVAMLIFGIISFPKMDVDLYPELDLPIAVVATSVDGGTPAEIETLVTRPIEEALASVANVDTISSNSISGASQVIIQFNWGTDIDQATLDMREQVDRVSGFLPDSANSPLVMKFDPNSLPIMTLALSGDGDISEIKSLADDDVKPNLERIDGVASVNVIGGQDQVVNVTLDPAKLQAYGITLDSVSQSIRATNLAGSAGTIKEGDQEFQIRVEGEYDEIKSIGSTPIALQEGSILLKDIAVVEDTLRDVTQLSYLNGTPSLGLSVTKGTGGNTVDIADHVHEEIAHLKESLPEGVNISVITDNSEYIKESISNVAEQGLMGFAFAILILFFFLNSPRSTLIVSIVIPISVVATFSMMYFSGLTINLISLSGLLLGLGSLVDFAIVILENIFRQRQLGKGIMEAAVEGSKQVGNAVMASALAQIVVFLPIIFVDGIAAELFGPLALTVIFSHIAALVVSLMLVPMLGARWLTKLPDESLYTGTYKGWNPVVWFNRGFEKLSGFYGWILKWALEKRKTVILGSLALLIASLALFPFIGVEFIPKMDEGEFSVSLELPAGTVIEETEEAVIQLEQVTKDIPEMELMYTSIGSAGGPEAALGGGGSGNIAQISVVLKPLEERKRSTEEVVQELREKTDFIPDAKITVEEVSAMGGIQGAPVDVSLRGDDLDVLQDVSGIIAGEVEQVDGTHNVKTSLDEVQEEFQVTVDTNRASEYGLNASQILSAVRTGFEGQKVTTYRTGNDEIDIRLQMPVEMKQDKRQLEGYRITTPQGANIALSAVANIEKKEVPQAIQRSYQTREAKITSDIAGRDTGSVTTDIKNRLDKLNLPDGYVLEYGGEDEQMTESFVSLGLAMVLSIILIYMVMAGQFESLITPFVIMFSIPPTIIGVILGLFVTGNSMSVMAIIGYILLIGIVVNNAIILLDFINLLRIDGMDRTEAILKAGPIRLRPILMTTLSTILAVLPLAFGGGAGNEAQAPMAIVVAFGLSFSTLITLVLIPVVYAWFDDVGIKRRERRNRKKNTGVQAENIQA